MLIFDDNDQAARGDADFTCVDCGVPITARDRFLCINCDPPPPPVPDVIDLPVEIRSPDRDNWFIAHVSVNEPGTVQLTGWDDRGPWGHTNWASAHDAVATATGHWIDREPPVGDNTYRMVPRNQGVPVGAPSTAAAAASEN